MTITFDKGAYDAAVYRLNPDNWERITRQHGDSSEIALTPSCTDTYLNALSNNQKNVSYIPYNTEISKFRTHIEDFKENRDKTILFVPIVIEGYTRSHELPSHASLLDRIQYLCLGFFHFLAGGSYENHIVLFTLTKENENINLEYYDPKGRSIHRFQKIEHSDATLPVCLAALGFTPDMVKYHNQGRIASDQSIFNTNECGFLVIRRIEQIRFPESKCSKNIRAIASIARTMIEWVLGDIAKNYSSNAIQKIEVIDDEEFSNIS